MTQVTIAAVIAGLSVAAFLTGTFRTLSSIGIFVAIVMIGFNGWLITHMAAVLGWVERVTGAFIAGAFGVTAAAVGAFLVAVVIYFVIHDWLPKHSAKKRTFILSALLAVLIVAGATPFVALNDLPATIGTGVSTVQGG